MGDPLVLGLHGQLVLGRCVVQAWGTLWHGVQVDGLNGAAGGQDPPGPGGPDGRAVCRSRLACWLNLRGIWTCALHMWSGRSHITVFQKD